MNRVRYRLFGFRSAILCVLPLAHLSWLPLVLSPLSWGAEDPLSQCALSGWPIAGQLFDCRQVTQAELDSLQRYWASEDDAELCHYFYFPLSDPSASRQLLLENYLIMQRELEQREVHCERDHRNIFWYRGEGTRSMLQKLVDRYDLDPNLITWAQ